MSDALKIVLVAVDAAQTTAAAVFQHLLVHILAASLGQHAADPAVSKGRRYAKGNPAFLIIEAVDLMGLDPHPLIVEMEMPGLRSNFAT